MKTFNLADLAVEALKHDGLTNIADRVTAFDAIHPAETIEPVDLTPYLQHRRPVHAAVQVTHDLLEKECVKIGQGNILWFPDGQSPPMIVKDAETMQIIVFAELAGLEISENTGKLLLAIFPCAYAAKLAREATERARLND